MVTKQKLANHMRAARDESTREALRALLEESLGEHERRVYRRVLAGESQAPLIAHRVRLGNTYTSNILRRLHALGLVERTGVSMGRVCYADSRDATSA